MAGMIQIQPGELQVGSTIKWPVYDATNRLLLKAGAIISSERQLESLLLRGMFRSVSERAEPEQPHKVVDTSSPFDRLDDLMRRVPGMLLALSEAQDGSAERALKLVDELGELYERWPDLLLGAVHLSHEYDYTQCHPIHTAILVEMMARKLKYEQTRIRSVVAGALTQNVAMVRLQETLQRQREPLNDAQRAAIRAHPAKAVQMLAKAGVTDPVWRRAVMQHHERCDGTGYPAGLKGETICEEAQLLALADRYAAMISARTYRDSLTAKDALKDFFLHKGEECGESLTVSFIQEIGVFPPGSFVRLNTGEIGVVIKRGKTSLEPVVSAYIAPRGAPYARPFRRDCASDCYSIRENCSPDTSVPVSLWALWSV